MAGIAFVIIFSRLVLDMCICAIFAVFCNIQGFLVLCYEHAPRPCLRVHRETGVLRVLLSVKAGLSHTIGADPLDCFGIVLPWGVGYCKGIAYWISGLLQLVLLSIFVEIEHEEQSPPGCRT